MKVYVKRPFHHAADGVGLTPQAYTPQTDDDGEDVLQEVPEELVPDLRAAGYVELPKAAERRQRKAEDAAPRNKALETAPQTRRPEPVAGGTTATPSGVAEPDPSLAASGRVQHASGEDAGKGEGEDEPAPADPPPNAPGSAEENPGEMSGEVREDAARDATATPDHDAEPEAETSPAAARRPSRPARRAAARRQGSTDPDTAPVKPPEPAPEPDAKPTP